LAQKDSFRFRIEGRTTMKKVNASQLTVCFCGGLAKIEPFADPELWGTTAEVAEMLRVSPRRVRQLVAEEGLPKAERGRFYLPDVFNFQNVRLIAERFGKRPLEMQFFNYVDFTLGRDSPLCIGHEAFNLPRTRKKKVEGLT
jgi:hypothetical protein